MKFLVAAEIDNGRRWAQKGDEKHGTGQARDLDCGRHRNLDFFYYGDLANSQRPDWCHRLGGADLDGDLSRLFVKFLVKFITVPDYLNLPFMDEMKTDAAIAVANFS